MTISTIERLRLTKELRAASGALKAASNALEKLRTTKTVREIRVKMGAGAAENTTPATTPEQDAAADFIAKLRAIAQGAQDAQGLNALYATIKDAVEGLDSAGALSGEAVDVSNEAITHWAELELQTNA